MISVFVALGGLAVAVFLSFVLSILLEMLLSIGKLHAALGGMGFFLFVPLAFIAELVGIVYGVMYGAQGWTLFFSPILGCVAGFVVMGLWFGASSLWAAITGKD